MSEQRPWRPILAIGGLLGLVGVVAFAAAARSPGGGESRPSGHAPTLLLDYIGTLALLVVPAGAILVVWSAFARREYEVQHGKRGRSPFFSLVILALVLGASIAVRTHIDWRSNSKSKPVSELTSKQKPEKRVKPSPAVPDYKGQIQWLPLFVVGSFVLAFGGAAGLLLWRRRHGNLLEGPVAAVLANVLAETLDDLRNEPDPRKAVIGAYAKMERTLAARGWPRQAFEAPVEYLVRILDYVQASAHSVRRLTKLFERARFSPHEIDSRMKDDAIEALAGLRAELEAAR
jgi:hypothetical protein